jgi:hypothetical protein
MLWERVAVFYANNKHTNKLQIQPNEPERLA